MDRGIVHKVLLFLKTVKIKLKRNRELISAAILLICLMEIMSHGSIFISQQILTEPFLVGMKSSIADSEGLTKRKSFLKTKLVAKKCEERQMQIEKFKNVVPALDSDCAIPVVTEETFGRLGNRICATMSLYVFKRHFGARIMIPKHSHSILNELFSDIEIQVGRDKCFLGLERKTLKYKKMYKLFEDNFAYLLKGNPLEMGNIDPYNVLEEYPCEINSIIPYRNDLREFLKVKPSLIALGEVAVEDELQKKNLTLSEVTLVSVHVRRGDILHIVDTYALSKVDYFLKAAQIYRKHYNKVVFVMISNDIEWCKKELNWSDAIFPGPNQNRDPLLDFAMITICNHHVTSPGTYSILAAFLGKGSTITYDIENPKFNIYDYSPEMLCSDEDTFIPIP